VQQKAWEVVTRGSHINNKSEYDYGQVEEEIDESRGMTENFTRMWICLEKLKAVVVETGHTK